VSTRKPHSTPDNDKLPGLQFAAGKALRSFRIAAELTQEDLAIIAGIDRNFLARIERGERRPSLTTIFLLATALQIQPEEIVRQIREHYTSKVSHP